MPTTPSISRSHAHVCRVRLTDAHPGPLAELPDCERVDGRLLLVQPALGPEAARVRKVSRVPIRSKREKT